MFTQPSILSNANWNVSSLQNNKHSFILTFQSVTVQISIWAQQHQRSAITHVQNSWCCSVINVFIRPLRQKDSALSSSSCITHTDSKERSDYVRVSAMKFIHLKSKLDQYWSQFLYSPFAVQLEVVHILPAVWVKWSAQVFVLLKQTTPHSVH